MTESINYSDGPIEDYILRLVKQSVRLSSDTDIAFEEYGQWPVEYHLSSSRPNCLRHLDFSGLDVLEFGAGMGAISRYLAEKAKHLTVVEGTEQRFSILSERLRDLKNWDGIVSNYQNFQSDRKYDLVCFCGVFEYAGKYIDQPEPFKWALSHAKSFLKDGGAILILIENKNGFKYFAGATEDHYGRHYAGICGYPLENDIKTFSIKEMRDLFSKIGMLNVDVQHLWPDYKLTQAVLTDQFVNRFPECAANIASSFPFRDYGEREKKIFPYNLGLMSMADSGLLNEFSNSYLFLASGADQRVKGQLHGAMETNRVQAFMYSSKRKYNVVTTAKDVDGDLFFDKKYLSSTPPDCVEGDGLKINLHIANGVPYVKGKILLLVLVNYLYYNYEQKFYDALFDFFDYAFDCFVSKEPELLKGCAFDALIHNAMINSNGLTFFDFEYELDGGMRKTYFIYRNVRLLSSYLQYGQFNSQLSKYGLYNLLCQKYGLEPDYDLDQTTDLAAMKLLLNMRILSRKKVKRSYRLLAAMIPIRAWRKKIRRRGVYSERIF